MEEPIIGDGHGHEHNHDHDHDHGEGGFRLHSHAHTHGAGTAPRAIVRAIAVTLVFMFVELAGGWWANSLALVSDGAHMLTDVGAMLLSLFAIWFARRPSTRTMSFGYHRAEILGALASGLMIWLIAGVLVYEALLRLREPPEVNGPVVFGVAAVGLAANLASMAFLHKAREDNINARAAYLHMLSDSLGSAGAIVAGAILWVTHWRPIDPIVTILFAALMLYSSLNLVKETVAVLMESTPSEIDPSRVSADLASLPSVQEIHDLHIWSVAAGRAALSVHLISRSEAAATRDLLNQANEVLESRHGIRHTTIQIEHPDHFASQRCYDCAPGGDDAQGNGHGHGDAG